MFENHCDCKPNDVELIKKVKKKLPKSDEIINLSNFLKTMGDSTRLQILMSLHESEMCVSDLANVLDMTKSAVSHQLKILRISKLIKFRRAGRTVYYSLDDDHIESILKKSLEHIQEK